MVINYILYLLFDNKYNGSWLIEHSKIYSILNGSVKKFNSAFKILFISSSFLIFALSSQIYIPSNCLISILYDSELSIII